ncbi:hypothetical protein SAMN05444362_102270 [Dysgonomonas macrotermitis]|uniref:HmuY protein n=2 Tax=Dysgonomonas macrotermitis TaxID=1346286 RepID=A0A1M4WN63_9BACT|nr:hypothetical protein SAMN05444362_102270 [Dysgonomonas macrotermitis]
MNDCMKNIYKTLSTLCMLFLSLSVFSQIGVYNEAPDASSTLDIKSTDRGVMIPRLTTTQKQAISAPAHSLLVYDTDQNCISQNVGTETVPEWKCLTGFGHYFFYMPSINIPTVTKGVATTIDLFDIYQSQYASPASASLGAPASIPKYLAATDLYYYITYHDPTLIRINSISNGGVMNYTVLRKANYDSYMNIVFVVK